MQFTIVNKEAEALAKEKGIEVVMGEFSPFHRSSSHTFCSKRPLPKSGIFQTLW